MLIKNNTMPAVVETWLADFEQALAAPGDAAFARARWRSAQRVPVPRAFGLPRTGSRHAG
jgi:hypothetical protein